MIKECLPKVGIKLLKISYVKTLFLVSLLFVVCLLFIVYLYKYINFSLAWPNPLGAGTYRLEIISAVPQGFGLVHIPNLF